MIEKEKKYKHFIFKYNENEVFNCPKCSLYWFRDDDTIEFRIYKKMGRMER